MRLSGSGGITRSIKEVEPEDEVLVEPLGQLGVVVVELVLLGGKLLQDRLLLLLLLLQGKSGGERMSLL